MPRGGVDDLNAGYLPTEADIRSACAEIQRRWSRDEERRRRSWSVTPPVVAPVTSAWDAVETEDVL